MICVYVAKWLEVHGYLFTMKTNATYLSVFCVKGILSIVNLFHQHFLEMY